MLRYVTASLESDRNKCNFSNMEYKLSKYIWNQQLTGSSASYLSLNNAKSHTVANDGSHVVEHVDMSSCRWSLCSTQFKCSTMKKTNKCVWGGLNLCNHFKCFVYIKVWRNGADNKMRMSRSRIQKVLMFTFQRNMCKIHQTLHFIS